jgi:hypothetical protein
LIFKYCFILQKAGYVNWIGVSRTGSQWLARTSAAFSCFGSNVKCKAKMSHAKIPLYKFYEYKSYLVSRDSAVSIATGYGLDD